MEAREQLGRMHMEYNMEFSMELHIINAVYLAD
jgi:hypothetical protein